MIARWPELTEGCSEAECNRKESKNKEQFGMNGPDYPLLQVHLPVSCHFLNWVIAVTFEAVKLAK